MQDHFIYPIYTSILALIAVILVPRQEIKRLARYGIFFGAVAEFFFIEFIGLIGMGEYLNFKYFGAFGVPFFPPIAWTVYFIMFFYLLPKRKPWIYLFPAIASCYSVFFSNILQALGIFKWNYGNPILPFILVYAPWHFVMTWIYLKIEGKKAQEKKTGKYRVIPVPAMKKDTQRRKFHFTRPRKI